MTTTRTRPATTRTQKSVDQVRREIATAQWRTANAIWQRELRIWHAMDNTSIPAEDEETQRGIVAMAYGASRDAYEAINSK